MKIILFGLGSIGKRHGYLLQKHFAYDLYAFRHKKGQENPLGIKEVYIRDYTFGVNKEYTKELCNRLIERDFDITWFCLSRVDVLDEETILLMIG